jgi:hypothetical protein
MPPRKRTVADVVAAANAGDAEAVAKVKGWQVAIHEVAAHGRVDGRHRRSRRRPGVRHRGSRRGASRGASRDDPDDGEADPHGDDLDDPDTDALFKIEGGQVYELSKHGVVGPLGREEAMQRLRRRALAIADEMYGGEGR